MNVGIIYKVVSLSGKVYVGQTILSLKRRKQSHVSKAFNKASKVFDLKFSRAIRKYGDSLRWETLCEVPYDKLDVLERLYIEQFNSYEKGYNSTLGGESTRGIKLSDKTKKKISLAVMGKNNPFYGKKHSENFKKDLSEMRKGEGNPFYGKKHSIESLIKMNINNPRFGGRKHSEESKKRIAESLAGEKSVNAKLSWSDVEYIRCTYRKGGISRRELGELYGVHKTTIDRILSRKTWKKSCH